MPSDYEIGRVVMVDTANVTVQLNDDLKALTKASIEGVQDIARINSYLVIPVGARRLIAIVTRVRLTEDAELLSDRASIALPAARRLVNSVLVGTIDGTTYTQGISVFPALDNPVCMVSATDLNVIFDRTASPSSLQDSEDAGYCISLGDSSIFDGFNICIDPDRAFGKHLAVLGSTGSGKSCTVASIIQSILSDTKVKQTNFIILDTNGEYRTAFQNKNADDTWTDIANYGSLYIPSEPHQTDSSLRIPYWFLNSADYIRLFRAQEGLQAPVLQRALRLSRAGTSGEIGIISILDSLRSACLKILATIDNDAASQIWAIPKNVVQTCDDSLKFRNAFPSHLSALEAKGLTGLFGEWESAITSIKSTIQPLYDQSTRQYQSLGSTVIQQIKDIISPVLDKLNSAASENPAGIMDVSADQPLYFSRHQFLERSLETAMHEQADTGNPGRIRDACGPMFLRIRRYFEDPRFNFLFGQHPEAEHILATFLRDVLGLPNATTLTPPLDETIEAHKLPFYSRIRTGTDGHNIVIIDLSLLASEVLENVTALIGRLILEFLQRLGESGTEESRGSLPVVLVLEEAQNYIKETRPGTENSISREIFERIAREGRKYGLGLVVSSQRPSELSKTVLSQCSSFIVHRLQNPEDLRYFKDIVPGVFDALLQQLPALAPQTALVLGECVKAPALVKIRTANPIPRSRDPKFYSYWTRTDVADIPVEDVCARWEGRNISEIPAGQNPQATGTEDGQQQ